MSLFNEFMTVLGHPMAVFGVVGQSLFSCRFLIQWIASERQKKSTVPEAFWYFSVFGGVLTLVYAIWRRDPVFSVAQAMGLLVYVRNIVLIRNHKAVSEPA